MKMFVPQAKVHCECHPEDLQDHVANAILRVLSRALPHWNFPHGGTRKAKSMWLFFTYYLPRRILKNGYILFFGKWFNLQTHVRYDIWLYTYIYIYTYWFSSPVAVANKGLWLRRRGSSNTYSYTHNHNLDKYGFGLPHNDVFAPRKKGALHGIRHSTCVFWNHLRLSISTTKTCVFPQYLCVMTLSWFLILVMVIPSLIRNPCNK